MSQLSTSTNKVSGFFSLLKQAIRGDEMDYTAGSIRKAVFMLAIPMMLEMCMESVFAIVDIFFVGKFYSGLFKIINSHHTDQVSRVFSIHQ